MIFRRAIQRYGKTPQPETPYSRAGQVWDERIGSARVQARNWRLMAFGCLALTGGLSAGVSVDQHMQDDAVVLRFLWSETGSPGRQGTQKVK